MPRAGVSPAQPEYWRSGGDEDGHRGDWLCLVCDFGNGTWKKGKNVKRHEESAKHQKSVQSHNVLRSSVEGQTGLQRLEEPRLQPIATEQPVRDRQDGSGGNPAARYSLPPQDEFTISGSGINFSLDDDFVGTPPPEPGRFYDLDSLKDTLDVGSLAGPRNGKGELAIALSEWFASGPAIGDGLSSDSEDESLDRPQDCENINDDAYAPDLSLLQNLPSKELGVFNKDGDWFPWANKSECVIDILRHLPRSIFSDKEMASISWAMDVLGISTVPSESRLKTITKSMQIACGIETIRFQGALGHIFYINNILQMIAQELSNPRVRPHLVFFPEDSPRQYSDACHGQRWLKWMDADLLSPMVREKGQDFYIFEPAMLASRIFCIPHRWYMRSGAMRGRAWRITFDQNRIFAGWIVHEDNQLDITATELVTSFPYLLGTFQVRGLPDPRNIIGILSVQEQQQHFEPWVLTDPQKGNKWRSAAGGSQVFAFPIWLYCDDTSGNSSKKWNKHNSFLFTPAGLSHEHMHFEYNVHFISTSNIAPPLEMAEAIVSLINEGQKNGIWAYDCDLEEMVLLIPSILAVLGDNPMQSELSCHVGLNGNLFCRTCHCRKGGEDSDSSSDSENTDDASDAANETNGKKKTAKKKKKKKKRTQMLLPELIEQATVFLTVGEMRKKEQTVKHLDSIYRHSCIIGGQARAKALKTSKGVKCTYQEHFLRKVNDFTKDLKGFSNSTKQRKLDRFTAAFPENKINPLWQVKGLDMHRDTPVEVLHVILLGFVKYFWRDAMKRLSADKKALVTIRISSFDTEGLGLSPLSGKTLVQYSGSLTGRDFRAISQIAPFILYDVLDSHIFEAWVALSALIPLIWQPVVVDIDDHLDKITMAIEYLLSCTARWTPQWFNKPKFHILLHLVEHIRQFGPALLFATETFESYNALIRSLSIHSNRQAPSRDIAWGFAHANRIRHLTSNGEFRLNLDSLHAHDQERKQHRKARKKRQQQGNREVLIEGGIEADNNSNRDNQDLGQRIAESQKTPVKSDYHLVGSEARAFLAKDGLLKRTFRGTEISSKQSASVQCDGNPVHPWEKTLSSKYLPPQVIKASNLDRTTSRYAGCKSCILQSGDNCRIETFVIAKILAAGSLVVGRVVEMLQIPGSDSEMMQRPDLFLLRLYSTKEVSTKYNMPKLINSGQHVLVEYENIMCTVNAQHNCADHNCSVKNLRVVRQERENTSTLSAAIAHEQKEDIILNCAQMRSSRYLKSFRAFTPYLDRVTAINEGAARELAERTKGKQNPAGAHIEPEEN